MIFLADVVLTMHFLVAAFITAGLILVPIGALRGWAWTRWRRLRLVHAGLMVFVAVEAIIGMTCPLTEIEAFLRGTQAPESFWGFHLAQLLYWDLPMDFFIALYVSCAVWALGLWILYPPEPRQPEPNPRSD